MGFLSLFGATHSTVVNHYKKKPTPLWEYENLMNQNMLHSSTHLKQMAKDADTTEKMDYLHQYMNNMHKEHDIYSLGSYRKLSYKLIEKGCGWE